MKKKIPLNKNWRVSLNYHQLQAKKENDATTFDSIKEKNIKFQKILYIYYKLLTFSTIGTNYL